MRTAANEPSAGLLGPVWNLLDHALAAAQNRLELFQVEAQEEKIRLFEILLLAACIMVLGTLAVALGTLAIILLIWPGGLLITLGCLIVAYALGAAAAWRGLRARLHGPLPFKNTTEEIKKDRACLPH